jgi:hypothetical protein
MDPKKYDPDNYSPPESCFKSFEANNMQNLESQLNKFCFELNEMFFLKDIKYHSTTKVNNDGSTHLNFTALVWLKLKDEYK